MPTGSAASPAAPSANDHRRAADRNSTADYDDAADDHDSRELRPELPRRLHPPTAP
jgi:hypothetical protein